MHLFEEYALSTGSFLRRPQLIKKFFPIISKKYITWQVGSGMQSKNYDYAQEVFDLVKPFLQKEGIDVIQLGLKDEPPIVGAINLCGQTNLGQSTYIIERGLLHMGTDSSLVHIASALNKPIVATYGISPPNVCGPFFNRGTKTICLEPNLPKGHRFSYNPNEQPKSVNLISPEIVASSILKLLKIKDTIKIETVFIGQEYKKHTLELIPDSIPHPNNFQGSLFNIRADLLFNENAIYGNISQRKSIIVAKNPLNVEILKKLKGNIQHILYILEIENVVRDLPFIKSLHESGLHYILLTHDLENISKLRFEFLDFNAVLHCPISKKEDIKNHEKISADSCFRTNKLLLSDGKVYMSRAHWEQRIEHDPAKPNKVLDCDSFFKDSQYMMVFNEQKCNEEKL